MNDLVVPTKVLTKNELELYAEHGKNTLLETYSGIEAFVLVKQMEELVKRLKEQLQEKAIASVNGENDIVFGAKVQLKRKVEYEYDCPTLERLEAHKKDIEQRIKAIKSSAEKLGVWIDDSTGEENRANKIGEGVTLTVTLPKE